MKNAVRREPTKKPRRFIFVCADGVSIEDRLLKAKDIALERISAGEWPIYKGTAWRGKMEKGDRCLFYLAGSGEEAQHFIGQAEICKCAVAARRWREPMETLITEPAAEVVHLESIGLYRRPVSVRALLDRLSFIRDRKRWGLYFIGGVRAISVEDFELVREEAGAGSRNTCHSSTSLVR